MRWPRTALQELEELDLTMAVQYGGADARLIKIESRQTVPWTEGRKLYESHVERPIISGEPHASTAKRYRAVFDKFIPFAEAQGRRTWNELNRQLMDDYACWLDGESDASATEYLELTTLKQILKFLIENRHPPNSAAFSDPLRKPDGTTRWTRPPPPLCEKIKIEAAAPSSLGLRANCAGERERTRPNDRGEAQERRSPDWHSFGTVGCANQDFCSQLTDLQQVAATTQNKRRGRDSNPRSGFPDAALAMRCFRPLSHLSPARRPAATISADRAKASKPGHAAVVLSSQSLQPDLTGFPEGDTGQEVAVHSAAGGSPSRSTMPSCSMRR